MTDSKLPLAQFTTNSFVSNPQAAIAIATVGGMMLMSVGIMVGAHVFLSMALLIGGILFVYGWLAGSVTYEVHPTGVLQKIKRFIPGFIGKEAQHRWIYWDDIRSYKNDKDWSRKYKEYEFLKLYLKKSPGQIWITDQNNKSGFERFKEAFLAQVEIQNTKRSAAKQSQARDTNVGSHKTAKAVIKRKRSFYKTVWAKLITIALILVTVLLVLATFGPNQKFTHFYRINFVLIPGTVYMIYRVFVKVDD